MQFETPFNFGDCMTIDGDRNGIIGTVTGFTFRKSSYYSVEVSYVANGISSSAWIEDWRLNLYKP